MQTRVKINAALLAGIAGAFLTATAAEAGTITVTDRPTLLSDLGAGATVEDFGTGVHFPISTGVLNSSTNLAVTFGAPITPGMIKPGVTYSTPIGTGFFFNIDAFGNFTGGLLDRIRVPGVTGPLTVTFDHPRSAFGFDTDSDMGVSFTVDITFSSGPDFVETIGLPGGVPGAASFGFESSGQDIVSATIDGNAGPSHGLPTPEWAIDNFTFGDLASGPVGTPSVDEPSTLAVLGAAFAGLGVLRRRRKRS